MTNNKEEGEESLSAPLAAHLALKGQALGADDDASEVLAAAARHGMRPLPPDDSDLNTSVERPRRPSNESRRQSAQNPTTQGNKNPATITNNDSVSNDEDTTMTTHAHENNNGGIQGRLSNNDLEAIGRISAKAVDERLDAFLPKVRELARAEANSMANTLRQEFTDKASDFGRR